MNAVKSRRFTPRIQGRTQNATLLQKAQEAGLSPRVAAVLAGRAVPDDYPIDVWLAPGLKHLVAPDVMADIEKAAMRVAHAIMTEEIIGLETDHDCDGQTSHAVLYEALTRYFGLPTECIRSYIGHRLEEGYGLSQKLTERILEDDPLPTVIITADNGSSDEARIKILAEHHIDVIVTDHHAIPVEGIPKSAYAVLNPTRTDCVYPDPYIAGCFVAWLLMAATRRHLISMGHLTEDSPHIAELLDFVAVGTVADCVSLAKSVNNRAVIRYGLKQIEKMERPAWRALRPFLNTPLTAEDLAFLVGPLLNSDGRLSGAMRSVSFLLADTDLEAVAWVDLLQKQNKNRKLIQKTIVDKGLLAAEKQVAEGNVGLVIYLPDGHAGVHGIAASKIKDHFGLPTVFFAPKLENPTLLTGSARGIDGFHVRNALQWIHDQANDLLVSFGGHQGAAGLSLHVDHLAQFTTLFNEAVCLQLEPTQLGPVILSDGVLSGAELSLALLDELECLQPYGRECEAPLFEVEAEVKGIKWLGEDEIHARLDLVCDRHRFSAIWFFARRDREEVLPIAIEDRAKVILCLKAETYRGERQLKPQIHYLEKV